MGVELDKWIEKIRRCEYLAEEELKALCDYVCAGKARLRAWEPQPAYAAGQRNPGGGIQCAAGQHTRNCRFGDVPRAMLRADL
jgi:hypothetical protein